MNKRTGFPFDILTIDRGSELPIPRQLYDAVRSYILTRRLDAGTALPATRTLARELGIGRNTVIAAYDQLLAEGFVDARAGSGTWVAAIAARATHRRPSRLLGASLLSARGQLIASRPQPPRTPGKINLHPGFPESTTFPFVAWSRLLARNAQRRGEDILGYHDFAGHPPLRVAIAEYVGVARGVDCNPDQVIITTGAQAALDLVARMLMDEGDCVWMEEPGYLGARSAFLGGGAALAPMRVREEGWQFHNSELPPPRLIYVTPACQWPRGTVMRMEERLDLLALADRHEAWIIEDDYDGEYRFRGRPIPALCGLYGSDRVIYVGTFGKTLFSSLRLGFLVVPERLSKPFGRAISVTGQFAPLVLQATLADFIRQGYFSTHLKRMRRLYARRQRRFVELCSEHLARWLVVAEKESGMQLIGRFVMPFNDREVATAALGHGIDVQPISINFHHDPPEHGLLLGFAGVDDHDTLAVIMALKATFKELEGTKSRIGPME